HCRQLSLPSCGTIMVRSGFTHPASMMHSVRHLKLRTGHAVKRHVLSFGFVRYSALVTLAIMVWIGGIPALASAPAANRMLNYQLRLTNPSGIAVANGVQELRLTIYDAASGGNQLYSVCTDDGLFDGTPTAVEVMFTSGVGSTLIGDTSVTCASGTAVAMPDDLFTNNALFLGVTVGADAEMTPRKRIVSSGYAMNADRLDNLETSNAGGTDAFVPVTDSSGNFTLTQDVNFANDTFVVDSSGSMVGIGAGTPSARLHVHASDANSTILTAFRLDRTDSDSVGAAGLGVAMDFFLENS